MKKAFFVTGASGVGKTSLIWELKQKHTDKTNWIFLHFDSIGIPTVEEMIEKFGSSQKWQEEMVHRWIKEMLKKYKNTDVIVFEGQVDLEFIKNAFSKNNFSNYKIILIDCDEKTMVQRLIHNRNQPELSNDDMKNWLKYLRKQASDLDVNIIDTSNLSKKKALKFLEETFEKR